MNREGLRERLAKAYCAPENNFKVVDPVLIESMIDQILGKELEILPLELGKLIGPEYNHGKQRR